MSPNRTVERPAVVDTGEDGMKGNPVMERSSIAVPRRNVRWRALPIPIVLLAALIWLPNALAPFQQDLATRILIFGLLAMSLDLVYGYAGMISLGHAAFFGAGGYATGLLMVRSGVTSFWTGALVGVLVAVALAAFVGFISLRTRGIYFILVTFALGQMVYSLAQQWSVLHTSGAEAVVGISPPVVAPFTIQWTSQNIYYFTLVICVLGAVVLFALTRSRFGSVLKGIRENERRMSAMGFNTWLYKYAAFLISGAVAGLAGVLFAYSSGIVAPSNVDVSQSGLIVLMIIIGGTGRLWGALIGAAVVEIAQFLAQQYTPDHQDMALGVLFVATLIVLRGTALWRARSARREREVEPEPDPGSEPGVEVSR